MPLKVIRRPDTGVLQIAGTIRYPDGTVERIRLRPQSNDARLAREEAVAFEAERLRTGWHGERRGARLFEAAIASYIDARPRGNGIVRSLQRILIALGPGVQLRNIDQEAVNKVRKAMLKPDAAPATVATGVISPIRAVLNYAAEQGWCEAPGRRFKMPKRTEGRTDYFLPADAQKLIAAAAPHVKPLLMFLFCTGARMAEAIELEWRDVDLSGRRVTFWVTKNGRRRIAELPPAAIMALTDLAKNYEPRVGGRPVGRVFRWQTVTPKRKGKAPPKVVDYADRKREYGGQIKTAWKGAIRRAGLDQKNGYPHLTPHHMRHTWASWHYATQKDLLKLKQDGGWCSVTLVERYAHLLPAGHEAEIAAFLAGHWSDTEPTRKRVRRSK